MRGRHTRSLNANDRDRSGYTLLELLVSSTAATMLMVGLGSAVVITSRAVAPDVGQTELLDAAESTFVISDELQSALRITDLSPQAVEFALADRDHDLLPELVRYELVMDELRRSGNGITGILQTDVATAQFTPQYRSVPETIGGVLSETDAGALAGITFGLNLNSWTLDPYHPMGQLLNVNHPADATMWTVSAARLYLRRSAVFQPGEIFTVQLREATGDGLPTSNVIDEVQLDVASLSTSFEIVTIPFTNADRLPVSTSLCLVLKADESLYGSAVQVAYTSFGFYQSGHFLSSASGDMDWSSDSGRGLYFLSWGTHHTLDDSTLQVQRSYLTGLTIQVAKQNHPTTVRRTVRLLNTPSRTSALWRLDFNRSPLDQIDVDYDGLSDWTYTGRRSSFEPDITDSVLSLDDGDEFQATAADDFAGLITVDLHCRALQSDAGGGAFLQFPFGADAGNHGRIVVAVEQTTPGTQTVSVMAADDTDGQTVARIRHLPNDLTECRIVVDPVTNFVAVWVNETFHGRTLVTQPLTGRPQPVTFGASGNGAELDFLAIQVAAAESL